MHSTLIKLLLMKKCKNFASFSFHFKMICYIILVFYIDIPIKYIKICGFNNMMGIFCQKPKMLQRTDNDLRHSPSLEGVKCVSMIQPWVDLMIFEWGDIERCVSTIQWTVKEGFHFSLAARCVTQGACLQSSVLRDSDGTKLICLLCWCYSCFIYFGEGPLRVHPFTCLLQCSSLPLRSFLSFCLSLNSFHFTRVIAL